MPIPIFLTPFRVKHFRNFVCASSILLYNIFINFPFSMNSVSIIYMLSKKALSLYVCIGWFILKQVSWVKTSPYLLYLFRFLPVWVFFKLTIMLLENLSSMNFWCRKKLHVRWRLVSYSVQTEGFLGYEFVVSKEVCCMLKSLFRVSV